MISTVCDLKHNTQDAVRGKPACKGGIAFSRPFSTWKMLSMPIIKTLNVLRLPTGLQKALLQ